MMRERGYVDVKGLKIDAALHAFLRMEALPGSGIADEVFWHTLAALVHDLTARNRVLLAKRDSLQGAIDLYETERRGQPRDPSGYRAFLAEIGYSVPEGQAFKVATAGVDQEIARIAGPQLVVPLSNARYALNAANARWGSLYDAFYGTDAVLGSPPDGALDRARAARVVTFAKHFLDETVPLAGGSHELATRYRIADATLQIGQDGGDAVTLVNARQLVGFRGAPDRPTSVLFANHGLHIELAIDADHPVGRSDRAHIADVRLEAALTSIMDGEDSISAVDGADKVGVFRNWLGLMKGDLEAEFEKAGRKIVRRLNQDRDFLSPDGLPLRVRGRSLMLVRNVGLHLTTPAVLDAERNEIFEGLLDAAVTVLIALHDLNKSPDAAIRNSQTGSLYIVKPKLHGPEEVAFAVDTFSQLERAFGLAPNTIKLGLMDEERRTSVNLLECIRAAKGRVCFVNTGFLDRTGDEIHTSMNAGPMTRKAEMKNAPWLRAYEDRNVAIALACGFRSKAQIGKGMWAKPDRMAEMLAEKIAHPMAGANTAWVPSPTAAVLHAIHYHRVDVEKRQEDLMSRAAPALDVLLQPPLADARDWTDADIANELDTNLQGILGYVVRWVDQGIGCSTVPDLNGVGLMEDRATCRISSQMVANWLHHKIVTRDLVMESMKRMAAMVDMQNAADPSYRPIAPVCDGPAFRAAGELVFGGVEASSGYTEPALNKWRAARKRELS